MFGIISSLFRSVLQKPHVFAHKSTTRRPNLFRHVYKKGSCVSVYVPEPCGERLIVNFRRPIQAGDVKDGKLRPTASTSVIRRGGKRQTTIELTLESAEALHAVLGTAIDEARAKKRHYDFVMKVFDYFSVMMLEKHNSKAA